MQNHARAGTGRSLIVSAAAAAAIATLLLPEGARANNTTQSLASKDNTLYEHPIGALSNGAGSYLFVGRTLNFGNRRALIQFDLPTFVPTNAQVQSATLDIFVSRAQLSSTVTLHKVSQSWGEGTSDAGDPGGGGALSTPGDATWNHRFYNTINWTVHGGDFVAADSASAAVGFGAVQFTSAQMTADVQNWMSNPSTNFGWLLKGDESTPQSAARLDSRENPLQTGPILTVDYSAATWNPIIGNNWSNPSNWLGGVPDGIGAEANFSQTIPTLPPHFVNLDGGKTLGFLQFDSTTPHVLLGAPITLDRSGDRSSVTVNAAAHDIATVLNLDQTTDFAVATGATLGVTQGLNGDDINKTGEGLLRTTRVRATDLLDIAAGKIATSANGGADGVTIVGRLSMAPSAALDLADNDLVVNDGVYTDVQAAVIAGFGNPNLGITSSASDGSQILALFDNAQVGAGDWLGHTIGASAVVGKYTYFGDANIDGQVSGDDYTVVDANLNTTPAVGLEWLSGDMNLDGLVTGDDYTVIDANLGLGNGNPLAPSSLSASAVPEPSGSLALSSFASLAMLSRRRTR